MLFDHHFPAATDIDALHNRSLHQLAAIEGEPGIIHPASPLFHQTDTHLLLAEVEIEGADEMHVTALHDDGLEVVRKRFLKRVQI